METEQSTIEPTAGFKDVRDKILHILKIYPRISPSMLQIGIGTSLPPTVWKPILEQLVNDKTIVREETSMPTPTGRFNSYTILSLADPIPA